MIEVVASFKEAKLNDWHDGLVLFLVMGFEKPQLNGFKLFAWKEKEWLFRYIADDSIKYIQVISWDDVHV